MYALSLRERLSQCYLKWAENRNEYQQTLSVYVHDFSTFSLSQRRGTKAFALLSRQFSYPYTFLHMCAWNWIKVVFYLSHWWKCVAHREKTRIWKKQHTYGGLHLPNSVYEPMPSHCMHCPVSRGALCRTACGEAGYNVVAVAYFVRVSLFY